MVFLSILLNNQLRFIFHIYAIFAHSTGDSGRKIEAPKVNYETTRVDELHKWKLTVCDKLKACKSKVLKVPPIVGPGGIAPPVVRPSKQTTLVFLSPMPISFFLCS